MAINQALTKDALLDIVVKLINFLKVPTFYMILTIVGAGSAEIVQFSTSMSLIFWVCSVLSFGYQDFMNRELTFCKDTPERAKYLMDNLGTLGLYLTLSIMAIYIAPFAFSFINIDLSRLDTWLLLSAVGLFIKNTISNIIRSFGNFRIVYMLSLTEFILFCTVGATLFYTLEENTEKLYLNIGFSGFILIFIVPNLLKKISLKPEYKLRPRNFLSVNILSSLYYLNVFWGTSYFIKTQLGAVSHIQVFAYDFIFIGLGPLFSMTISFLHIKNIISRNDDRLIRLFVYACIVAFSLIGLTFIYTADFRLLILLCLLCLIFAVELFGFNIYSMVILSAYSLLVYATTYGNTGYALGSALLFGWLMIFYPRFTHYEE